jgi:hypothetical protein
MRISQNIDLEIYITYEGPGQKYGDYRPSDAEGPLKHRIKIAYTR